MSGWKTYAFGAATILFAVCGVLIGEVSVEKAVAIVSALLAGQIMSLRHAVDKQG